MKKRQMKYLTLHQAIFIHDKMLEKIGGSRGYNKTQISYLSSALENIKNDLYYPTMADKLAHLTHSCIKFHPFTDGNKRTAILLADIFLSANSYSFGRRGILCGNGRHSRKGGCERYDKR